jgi:hypothetical protein
LLGMTLLGRVKAERSGHLLHAALMSSLLRNRARVGNRRFTGTGAAGGRGRLILSMRIRRGAQALSVSRLLKSLFVKPAVIFRHLKLRLQDSKGSLNA